MSTSTARTSPATTAAAGSPDVPQGRDRLGRVVAGSLAVGLVAGIVLAFAPFVPATPAGSTGALLIGFAIGWAMLAQLSTRFTRQPQRWAVVPAVVLAVGGAASLVAGSSGQHALSWVWPPALLGLSGWMAVQVRRHVRGAGAKILLYPVVAVLALASVAGGVESVLEAADASRHPMAGQLVDVDGHLMHLSCTGTGSPTVVLEPGAGDMAATMAWIAPAVARDTRVCVYDRPGRGWSDQSDAPQDGTRVAADLHTLLHAAHVPGPYVLAGHSFGGLYVMAYAAHYPADVAGMVLVDTTAPTTAGPGPVTPAERNDALVRASALMSVVSRFGLGRAYAATAYDSLPSPAREELRASIATPTTLMSTIDEYVQGNASMQEAAELRTLGGIPLFVLTAGNGNADGWIEKQDRIAALSTNSVHRIVDGATHEELVSEQAPAASTTAAIGAVVASVRTGTPLRG